MKHKLIIILLILILNVSPILSETIIYENQTTTNCKTFQITDDINLKVINEYTYPIYLNNFFLGNFKKDDIICIPDNSILTIYVPAPISTNFDTGSELAKTYLAIAVMYLFVFIAALAIIVYAIKKIFNRK